MMVGVQRSTVSPMPSCPSPLLPHAYTCAPAAQQQGQGQQEETVADGSRCSRRQQMQQQGQTQQQGQGQQQGQMQTAAVDGSSRRQQ